MTNLVAGGRARPRARWGTDSKSIIVDHFTAIAARHVLWLGTVYPHAGRRHARITGHRRHANRWCPWLIQVWL